MQHPNGVNPNGVHPPASMCKHCRSISLQPKGFSLLLSSGVFAAQLWGSNLGIPVCPVSGFGLKPTAPKSFVRLPSHMGVCGSQSKVQRACAHSYGGCDDVCFNPVDKQPLVTLRSHAVPDVRQLGFPLPG